VHSGSGQRDAVMPTLGSQVVGSADQLADEAHGAGAALSLARALGRIGRIHQENADHAG